MTRIDSAASSRPKPNRRPRNPLTLAAVAALWIGTVGNWPLWRALVDLPEMVSGRGALFIGGFAMVIAAVVFALLALVAWRWTLKPTATLFLISAAIGAHFMGTYGIVIDPSMMVNVVQTDVREVRDLLSWRLVASVLLMAVPPCIWIWRARLRRGTFWPQLGRNGVAILASALVIALVIFALFSDIAATMRNHRSMRYLINPLSSFYSLGVVATQAGAKPKGPRLAVGVDARPLPQPAGSKPLLLLFVIGETARSDHFSLNGYARPTNSELARRGVVSFRDVTSCGTNTAWSLPCMLSPLDRKTFDSSTQESENLLDVLQRAGLAVLWLDNQAGCKGLCDRVPNAQASVPPSGDAKAIAGVCDGTECLDEVLLQNLDARLAAMPEQRRAKGVVLVLHQMGSHGPAYYKRSPSGRKPFLPECTTNLLQQCEHGALINAYDNSIAYTDYVLAKAIDWLGKQIQRYDPELLYVSDHGESLGENNVFLHGMPYSFAPREQTHVPMVLWLAPQTTKHLGVQLDCLQAQRDIALTHGHLFHTVLGLAGVTATEYKPAMDVLTVCKGS